MNEVTTIDTIPVLSPPIALTIGCFDGVHLGHRSLIDRARFLVGSQGSVALLTFSNHPTEFFRANLSIPKLSTPAHKMHLLKNAGVDLVIHLEFTHELSTLSTLDFLRQLKAKLPFSYLILGRGATLGHNQEGDEKHVTGLQQALDFTVEYIEKTTHGASTISSGLVRKNVEENELQKAATLLGRPYSIYVDVDENSRASAHTLCLPPNGNYTVAIHSTKGTHQETLTINGPHLTLSNTPAGEAEIVF